MAALIRWSPTSELVSLRRSMERLFDDGFFRPIFSVDRPVGTLDVAEYTPALDMYQTSDHVVVKTSLPGMKPEDVSISITGDTLTISGESKAEEEVKRDDYYRHERRYGSFKREVTLPGVLKTDAAEATFEDGILTISLPKAEEVKPKKINVKAKEIKKEEEAHS